MTANDQEQPKDRKGPGPRQRRGGRRRSNRSPQPRPVESAAAVNSDRTRPRGGKRRPTAGATLGRGLKLSAIATPFLTVMAAAAFAYFARPILIPLTAALMLAYVLAPAVDLLTRWRLPRGLGVVIVLTIAVGILGGLGFLIIDQAQGLVRALPSYWQNLQLRLGNIDEWIARLPEPLQELLPQTQTDIWVQLGQFDFAGATGTIFSGLGSVVAYLGWGILITFLTLFMLMDMPNLRGRMIQALGRENESAIAATMASINDQLRGYLTVKLVTSAGLGAVATVGLLLLDVPYAYVWGPLIGILNIIPYIGSFISAIPPIVISMIHHNSIISGVWVLLLILVLQQLESNLITPKLIGSRISINVVAVLVATLVWGWLWGPFGILLAIPMTAAVKVICERIEPLRPIAAILG